MIFPAALPHVRTYYSQDLGGHFVVRRNRRADARAPRPYLEKLGGVETYRSDAFVAFLDEDRVIREWANEGTAAQEWSFQFGA